MNPEAWIALGAVFLNIVILAVGYGVMKGSFTATMSALAARVTALEGEMTAISTLKSDVARIDERTKAMSSGIESILNSWLLREPPAYGPPSPAPTSRRRP